MGAIRAATAAITSLPPAHAGLGTAVDEEVAALADLIETAQVALHERVAVLDASGAHRSTGHPSVEAWLAEHTPMSRLAAGRTARLARRLHRHAPVNGAAPLPGTAAALREGRLTVEHAHVIATGTTHLPPEVVPEAEAVLVEAATRLAPAQLRIAARRLQRLLLPDHEERAEVAHAGRYLHLTPALFGMWAIDGLVDAETGAALKAAFDHLLALRPTPTAAPEDLAEQPTVDDALTDGEETDGDRTALALVPDPEPARPTRAQRRADALGQILTDWLTDTPTREQQATGRSGAHSTGRRPQLVIHVDLPTLTGANPAGLGHLSNDPVTGHGTDLTPDAVRRIGCGAEHAVLIVDRERPAPRDPTVDADLFAALLATIPPALGGLKEKPLHLGRLTRLHSPHQRLAITATHHGCARQGCHAPPEHCEPHHEEWWSHGGGTDVDSAIPLCRWDHHLVHDRGWTIRHHPDGSVTLHPPRRE